MSKSREPQSIEVICSECGSIFNWLPHGEQKARSPEQHRRFFLVMKLCFEAWPQDHPEQFTRVGHLRNWLTMKAGKEYREVDSILPIEGMPREIVYMLAKQLVTRGDEYRLPVVHGDKLYIWKAKSLSFLTMGHRAFNELNTRIEDFIKAETKLEPDSLIKDYFEMKRKQRADMMGRQRERQPRHLGEDWAP
jgi:hypothetical protein